MRPRILFGSVVLMALFSAPAVSTSDTYREFQDAVRARPVGHGARVYFRLCESCHGPSGQGDPNAMIPRIGGQHYEYLRRQIYDAVDGRRPGFPASHIRLLARLDHDDIAGVADYLSRMLNNPANPRMLPAAAH
jgi:cytochrome c553